MPDESRDYMTIEDDQGNTNDFAIEALFDMGNESYALLSADDKTVVMRVKEEEGNQYLVGIDDPMESQSILEAYQIAVSHTPAE
ncbi:DUF1292 domain-containing protein [Bacillus xiapuensis]|uniref:DUF1292 domain-containing protein n=1 Tax=Bacillus xiapuensis TaxID=2014075 RepID=A0ABU6N9J2_9BACI|nr:DUF1292 domain-containing protein [Bacillus xiapuensis]